MGMFSNNLQVEQYTFREELMYGKPSNTIGILVEVALFINSTFSINVCALGTPAHGPQLRHVHVSISCLHIAA